MPLERKYLQCPFKPPSTITVIGNQVPSDACTDRCALFMPSGDPRTGKIIPGVGYCALAGLTLQVAQLVSRIDAAAMPQPPAGKAS